MTSPAFTFAAILFSMSLIALGEDWPQWRGPARDGVSAERGLAQEWPQGGPPVLWTARGLGEGYGAISTRGGRVYVQGTLGAQSMVFCLTEGEGRMLWARRLGPRFLNDQGNGPRSSPTIEGDWLYVLTPNGELACLSAQEGSIRWRRNVLEEHRASNIYWGISESPLIEGEKIIVVPGGRRASVVALAKDTGKTLWKSRALSDPAGYASAIAAEVGSVRIIIAFTQKAGVGLDAESGRLLWCYEAPANDTANCATPVFSEGKVFYTSAYGTGCGLIELLPRAGGIEMREVYFNNEMQNHHGGVVLVEGYLYGFSGQALTCMRFDTGERVWRDRSVGKGSLIYADGRLYLLGEAHTMGLAEATPEGYREISRFKIEDRGRPSWAHPVVSNGRLYVRNQDRLTAYDVRGHP